MPPKHVHPEDKEEEMPPSSPTIAQWELAIRLRDRRQQLGMDVKTITARLGFSRNYWSAVENNRTILAEEKLEELLILFEFDEAEMGELRRLREAAKERAWWARYSAVLNEDMRQFYGLEHGARSVQTYEVLLITGLLQTEEYARAVIASDPSVSTVLIDQTVAIRMQRQQRLRADDPLVLTALMSEAALRQETGGPDVLRRQLLHLVSTIEELADSVEVRVVPFDTTPGGVVGASTLFLMDFASPRLPTVAWQEAITPVGVIEDPLTLGYLRSVYAQGVSCSLSREDSLDLIKRRAKELS